MRGLTLATPLLVTSLAAITEAQPPKPPLRATQKSSVDAPIPISLGQLTPTPEMWFYDQAMRRRSDPHVLVQEKASYDAAQRQRRLATQRWFGISNARPSANVTPLMGNYSPSWVSNTANPMQWSGQNNTNTVYRRVARRSALVGDPASAATDFTVFAVFTATLYGPLRPHRESKRPVCFVLMPAGAWFWWQRPRGRYILWVVRISPGCSGHFAGKTAEIRASANATVQCDSQ